VTGEPLKRVGRYEVHEVLGRGGAAAVYLAYQADLDRHVALKELAPLRAADETFARRFVEESRLAGAMAHANIVVVHEYFEDGASPYIAMEYLPNGSLRDYIDKLTLAQIAGVLEGVLAGLSYGQAMHIVHRDLKPENLLVSAEGRVKIADFGVARAIDQAAGTRDVVTVTGTTIGTPAYMAPEQALSTELTAAVDLYAVGMVAWELLTGRTPYTPTDSPAMVLYRKVHEEIPRVSAIDPEVDPRLDAWVATMLAREPGDRYASAEEAWYALEDVILDLLGPRWRRDAAIVVAGTDPAVEAARADDAPVPGELEPAAFTETAAGRLAPAPVAPPRARTADGAPASRRSTGLTRRRAVIASGGVALVAAIAAVVVLLSQGGSSPGAHRTTSQSTPAAAAKAPRTWYAALWMKIDPPGVYTSRTQPADVDYVKACRSHEILINGVHALRQCGQARVAVEYHGTLERFNGGNCQLAPTGKLRELVMNFCVQPVAAKPVITSPRNHGGVIEYLPAGGAPSLYMTLAGKNTFFEMHGYIKQGFPLQGAVKYRKPRDGITAIAWQCRGAIKRTATPAQS
jgi:tRNA A-37 threonylcarbamoyl transferase component Bud32